MSVKILFMKYLIIALISDFLVDTSLVCGIKCTLGEDVMTSRQIFHKNIYKNPISIELSAPV